MSDASEDALDKELIDKLKAMTPRGFESGASESPTTADSIVFQAGYQVGYQAACDELKVLEPASHDIQSLRASRSGATLWGPVVAASLVTAVLTLPIAFRLGRESSARSTRPLVTQDDQRSIAVSETLEEDLGSATPTQDETDSGAPTDDTTRPLEAFGVFRLSQLLRPDLNPRKHVSETLTAFDDPSLESLPRSNWIAMEDDFSRPQQTLSARDFGQLTLGLEVNPR